MTAIVTGGGSGIGAAVVRRLRRLGQDVVVWDIVNSDIRCDISDPDSVSRALQEMLDAHETPDRLVACAGVRARGMLLDQSVSEWRRVLDTNLTGTFFTLRAVAGAMVKVGKGGSIVAVSSISGAQSNFWGGFDSRQLHRS